VWAASAHAWIALMLGRDGQDPLFLQLKGAEASVFIHGLVVLGEPETA
jgi:hypothetical protein